LLKISPQSGPPTLAELSASIIARCCETTEQQRQFAQQGTLQLLVDCLFFSHPKIQESALDALAALCRDNKDLAKTFLNAQSSPQFSAQSMNNTGSSNSTSNLASSLSNLSPTSQTTAQSTLKQVFHHLHDARPSMRLIAATCLANLYRCAVMPTDHLHDVHVHLLPTLIKLFHETQPAIREKAPLVLAYLVSESEEMQKAVAEADAIGKLASVLASVCEQQRDAQSEDGGDNAEVSGDKRVLNLAGEAGNRLMESVLLALAAICSLKEECRKQVLVHILF
jgi:hypothetical protein